MKRTTAILLGFLIAPLLPAFLFAVQTPLVDGDFVAVSQLTLLFYFVAGVVAILLGIPSFALLWKLKLVTWWCTLLAGFIIGSLVAVILGLPSLSGMADIPVMGLTGAAATLAFWLIYRLGRIENENESVLLRRE